MGSVSTSRLDMPLSSQHTASFLARFFVPPFIYYVLPLLVLVFFLVLLLAKNISLCGKAPKLINIYGIYNNIFHIF